MSEHDYLVRTLINDLFFYGFTNIQADVAGYAKPGALAWVPTDEDFIPDVTAVAPDGSFHIFEVEATKEELEKLHTRKQLATFGTYATENKDVYAWLVYPRHLEFIANIVARRINFFILSVTRPTPQLRW